jgi:hypothetical protein
MAALSSFIMTCNDRYAHDCKDGAAVKQDGSTPECVYRYTTAWNRAVLWAKDMAA